MADKKSVKKSPPKAVNTKTATDTASGGFTDDERSAMRERAKELQLCEKTLRRAITRRELGAVRLGDLIYISETHIGAWLARNERKAAA